VNPKQVSQETHHDIFFKTKSQVGTWNS